MQELKFSYGDLAALLALILTIGNLWKLKNSIIQPREQESEMVKDHHRILMIRKDEINRVEKKADLALKACFRLMRDSDKADLFNEILENEEFLE